MFFTILQRKTPLAEGTVPAIDVGNYDVTTSRFPADEFGSGPQAIDEFVKWLSQQTKVLKRPMAPGDCIAAVCDNGTFVYMLTIAGSKLDRAISAQAPRFVVPGITTNASGRILIGLERGACARLVEKMKGKK